jgi:hypothetical protein
MDVLSAEMDKVASANSVGVDESGHLAAGVEFELS